MSLVVVLAHNYYIIDCVYVFMMDHRTIGRRPLETCFRVGSDRACHRSPIDNTQAIDYGGAIVSEYIVCFHLFSAARFFTVAFFCGGGTPVKLLVSIQDKMNIVRSNCDAANFTWGDLCGLAASPLHGFWANVSNFTS